MEKKFIASVVIPVHNRKHELEKAINSIIKCNGSSDVQIIVVDDCSDEVFRPNNIRSQDLFLRLDKNCGAAIARNTGIKAAHAENIYLLDSDDYFLERDFNADSACIEKNTIYYCQVVSGSYKSNFPNQLNKEDFFDAIFYKHKYITQTSTLIFKKNDSIFFDESLPRHQDWDLVYSHLMRGGKVKRIDGTVFFNRADKNSISRSSSHNKSKFWVTKVLNGNIDKKINIDMLLVNTIGRSSDLPLKDLIVKSLKLIIAKKIKFNSILKIIYARIRS